MILLELCLPSCIRRRPDHLGQAIGHAVPRILKTPPVRPSSLRSFRNDFLPAPAVPQQVPESQEQNSDCAKSHSK